MKIYVMTDSHLGHEKLLSYGDRQKGYELEIIKSIQQLPNNLDLCIHLGDVCIGNDEQHHNDLLFVLRSKFRRNVLVRGNHDGKSDNWYYERGWDFVCDEFTAKFFGKRLLFRHIPIPADIKGGLDFNIHGHLHGAGENSHRAIADYDSSFHIDVAPELRGYPPVNLEKLI